MSSVTHIIRPSTRRGLRLGLCLVVFLASGAGVYIVGYHRTEGTERYTARAGASYKSPGDQGVADASVVSPHKLEVQRQILSDESLYQALNRAGTELGDPRSPQVSGAIAKARGQLQIDVQGTAQQPEIAIACTGDDATETIHLVNQLAKQYATAEHGRLERIASRRHQQSQQTAEQSQQELAGAVARLDRALKQQASTQQPSGESRPPLPPETEPAKPLMVDNPLWLQLNRELTALERRQAELLVDRTPLHPEVQAVVTQIAELREKQTHVPRQIPDPSGRVAAAMPPQSMSIEVQEAGSLGHVVTEKPEAVRELATLRAAVDQAQRKATRLAELERQASAQKLAVPLIDVQLAQQCQVSREPLGVSLPLLLTALSAGLAMAIGVGMVLVSLPRRHPVQTVAELQSLVPVPIIGTISLAEPSRPQRSSRSLVSLVRALTFTYGMTLISVCLLILFMAFTQT
jgi:hypothetical protein